MVQMTDLRLQRAFSLELERIPDSREQATESFQSNDEYQEETRRVPIRNCSESGRHERALA